MLTGVAVIAVGLYIATLVGWIFPTPPTTNEVFCTQDAKQCPDGSYVGRTGPNCEFVCPAVNTPIKVEAQIGKEVFALGVKLLPLEIKEDSRCPADVQCVWAGTVRTLVRINSGLGKSEMIFTLGTPITTEVEVVTLIEVRPAPTAGVKIATKDYIFVFQIEKRQ